MRRGRKLSSDYETGQTLKDDAPTCIEIAQVPIDIAGRYDAFLNRLSVQASIAISTPWSFRTCTERTFIGTTPTFVDINSKGRVVFADSMSLECAGRRPCHVYRLS